MELWQTAYIQHCSWPLDDLLSGPQTDTAPRVPLTISSEAPVASLLENSQLEGEKSSSLPA